MKHAVLYLLLLILAEVIWLPEAHARSPLRVLCVESGSLDYNLRLLHGFAKELRRHNFLTAAPPPLHTITSSQTFWHWLAQHADQRTLQFVNDGFYSFDWDESKRRWLRESIRLRLDKKRDADVLLAIGTPAGLDMAWLNQYMPVIVMGVTNVVEAGIVPSIEDSGQNNLVAIGEPLRYRHQLEYFQKILPFRRLGLAYENSDLGKSMIALSEIESAARDLGFELVPCTADLFDDPLSVAEQLTACHRFFVQQHVDAVYLTYTTAISEQQKRRALELLINAEIPTFSQALVEDVQYGALLSFVDSGEAEGQFAGNLLRMVHAGYLPRTLPQHFQSPRLLAINLRTAAMMGWDPSLEVLLSVDVFFK